MARRVAVLVAALFGASVIAPAAISPAVAHADPTAGAEIVRTEEITPTRTDIWVDSPTMDREMKLSVLTPGWSSGPRPTVYMLDGNEAPEDVNDWITKGGAVEFFNGRNVNVVLPTGGGGLFYTDWQSRDPEVGKPMWETFLAKELPKVIDTQFDGSGKNAVIGLSMGGQAAYALTARNPEVYQGAASLSGCPPVSNPANEAYVRSTVATSGGDADNMWGPFGSQGWRNHDPGVLAEKLRGKALFLSAGSGAIGPLDLQRELEPDDPPREAVLSIGSALEVGAYRCSLEFALQLRTAGVDYTDGFRLIGTHAWDYWERDLPRAWATLSRALY